MADFICHFFPAYKHSDFPDMEIQEFVDIYNGAVAIHKKLNTPAKS